MERYRAFTDANPLGDFDFSNEPCVLCGKPIGGNDYSFGQAGLRCGPCESDFYGDVPDDDYGDHGPLDSDPYDVDRDEYIV